MEQIIGYLKVTGFVQPHSANNIDFENLILKPGEDRIELIQWCLSEIDESLRAKLSDRPIDDELKNELLTLIRKLGLSSQYDHETVLGLGKQKKQIAFWLELLHVVKCVQNSNKLGLPAERQSKTFSNRSQMWCELLQSSKYTDSSCIKMNLIPIELKIRGQQETVSLSSVVEDKHLLQERVQAMKEENQRLLNMSVSDNCGNNIPPADMKVNAENIKELSNKLNLLYQDEFTLQPQHLRPIATNQDAQEMESTIPNVFRHFNTFTQTARLSEVLVNAYDVEQHRKNLDSNEENVLNTLFEYYRFLEDHLS